MTSTKVRVRVTSQVNSDNKHSSLEFTIADLTETNETSKLFQYLAIVYEATLKHLKYLEAQFTT